MRTEPDDGKPERADPTKLGEILVSGTRMSVTALGADGETLGAGTTRTIGIGAEGLTMSWEPTGAHDHGRSWSGTVTLPGTGGRTNATVSPVHSHGGTTTTSTAVLGPERDRSRDFWEQRREWAERMRALFGVGSTGSSLEQVGETRRAEVVWGLRQAVGEAPPRRAGGASFRSVERVQELASLGTLEVTGTGADRTSWVCGDCGNLVDTPGHELGCETGRREAKWDREERGEE